MDGSGNLYFRISFNIRDVLASLLYMRSNFLIDQIVMSLDQFLKSQVWEGWLPLNWGAGWPKLHSCI